MWLLLLVSIRFQVYFTPLIGVLFTFPSRYLFTIGHRGVLRLGGWSPHVQDRISRVPPYSRTIRSITRTGLSPTMAYLSRLFRFLHNGHWPGPRSLVTTNGVSVDVLSSGYLDISVRRVCFPMRDEPKWLGFPHSEIRGSKLTRSSPQLIAACHVLHRLSVPRHPPNALQDA